MTDHNGVGLLSFNRSKPLICFSPAVEVFGSAPHSCVQAINYAAPIHETTESTIDVNKVLNVQGFKLEKVLEMDPNFLKVRSLALSAVEHSDDIRSLSRNLLIPARDSSSASFCVEAWKQACGSSKF